MQKVVRETNGSGASLAGPANSNSVLGGKVSEALRAATLVSVSLLAMATPALAQNSVGVSTDELGSGDIVVTARRREESQQDVPLVVNAVTSRTLDRLNIRDLRDISVVVPGLSFAAGLGATGGSTTLRGINFDQNSSGNNGTVEFYLNEEPVSSAIVLQSMFDIGQIEVLRGPQGTLRGRASPSGSVTVTTRRPDMNAIGGYLNGTVTDLSGYNLQGAFNLPIVKDVLALRVAGLFDDNQFNRVKSVNPNAAGIDPKVQTRSERVTLEFRPADNIQIVGRYQHFVDNRRVFDQVESANFAVPTAALSPFQIKPGDRASVMDIARQNRTAFDVYNLQAEWQFAGQKLNYVMGIADAQLWSVVSPNDTGDFYGTGYNATNPVTAPNDLFATGFATRPNLNTASQPTRSTAKQRSYELRLSSDERLFGVVDYVIGGLINKSGVPFNLWSETPLFAGAAPPNGPLAAFAISNIVQTGRTLERSAFGNVTVHLDDATEVSGGLRYISYKNNAAKTIQVNGGAIGPLVANGNQPEDLNATIYSASLKHRFSDNLMVYASTGSSWRASAQTNGVIDGISGLDRFPFGNLAAILRLKPERSKSYEIGLKSDWFDKRLHVNVTAYHQDFTDYFYSAPNIQVAQRAAIPAGGSSTAANPGDTYAFNTLATLAVNVPAKVDGIEGDFGFQVTPEWNIGGTVSYSISKIKNAPVPCNLPAASAFYGTNAAAFVAANGGQQYGSCVAGFRAGNSAPFSASFQSEYARRISDRFAGFIRALVNFNGNSENDPTNPIDRIKGYGLVNLYLGLRDPDGNWELTGYVKNMFDTQRVLTRDASPLSTSYQVLQFDQAFQVVGVQGGAGFSSYRGITMTAPREFGLNLRISFGSR